MTKSNWSVLCSEVAGTVPLSLGVCLPVPVPVPLIFGVAADCASHCGVGGERAFSGDALRAVGVIRLFVCCFTAESGDLLDMKRGGGVLMASLKLVLYFSSSLRGWASTFNPTCMYSCPFLQSPIVCYGKYRKNYYDVQ